MPEQASAPAGLDADRRSAPTTTLENLVAFARLYGYVRFFHPSDAAAEADWRALAVAGVEAVCNARTVGELELVLDVVLGSVAPTMQMWVEGEPSPPLPSPPRRRDRPVYWQYQGFPGTPVSTFRPPYRRVRVGADSRTARAFPEMPPFDARIEVELARGLHVRLPLVLSTEDAARSGLSAWDTSGEDRGTDEAALASLAVRRAAVIEVWNVLRHFYPYQQIVGPAWGALLMTSLQQVERDRSLDDTLATLRRLVHAIHDGHGSVGHVRRREGYVPFRVELVEGRGVITATEDLDHFAVGDVIERVDGEPLLDRIARLERLLSGTDRWRLARAATPYGPLGTAVEVTVRRGDATAVVSTRFECVEAPRPARLEPVHTFEDGVMYVDCTRVSWHDVKERLPEFAAAPGIVFDVRGYPKEMGGFIDHLLRSPEDARWLHVPRIVEPDGNFVAWHTIGWHRRPAAPRIEGRVAFLISAEAISYAESILGYVEAHGLGTLVGEPTAGTNGDIVRFDALGGLYVIFTGMRVTRHDGSEFHLRGVEPHVRVDRTLAGLRRGRDEVLEAGLASVRAAPPDLGGAGLRSSP